MDILNLLHPDIVKIAKKAIEAEDFDSAIFLAFKYVEAEIQERTGSSKIGMDLINQAFDELSPKIDISNDSRDRKGIKEIFSGALLNIRNDRGHKKVPFLPCNTIESCYLYLSFASFLLYLLSKDRNLFPEIQNVRIFGIKDHPRAELRGLNFTKNTEVYAETKFLDIIKYSSNSIEVLLPRGFIGDIKAIEDGVESNKVFCDTNFIETKPENTYEIVDVEIPLYRDAKCTEKRDEVVGLIVRVSEAGRDFLRITPVHPGKCQTGYFVTHGPFEKKSVGETWYRDPANGSIQYAWTGSLISCPEIICKSEDSKLGGISILPTTINTQVGDNRTLRIIGWTKKGSIQEEVDITEKAKWKSFDETIAYIKNAVIFPKKIGRTSIECQVEGFIGRSDITVGHFSEGDKTTYFQGLRRLQQIRFDLENNLYITNQSPSVFRLSKNGGFDEELRIHVPETYTSGIDCIAVDNDKNIYVNDMLKGVCLKFDCDGKSYSNPKTFATVVEGTKKSIVVDNSGNIYVAVMGRGRKGFVIHVDKDGKERFFETTDLAIYIDVDKNGNIYLPSSSEQSVHIYSPEGKLINKIFHGVKDSPSDILIDEKNQIYLPLFRSGKVLEIRHANGEIHTEFIADGFQNPGGIAMDSSGNIYVSNFERNSIDLIYM